MLMTEIATPKQAYHYIVSGNFPKLEDSETLFNLRDDFDNLPYYFLCGLLIDERTKTNADTLLKLIWSGYDIMHVKKSVESYENFVKETEDKNTELSNLINKENCSKGVKDEIIKCITNNEIKLMHKRKLYSIDTFINDEESFY